MFHPQVFGKRFLEISHVLAFGNHSGTKDILDSI